LGTGQFNGGNDTPEHRAPAQLKRTFTVGLLALVLLILNTAVFTFSYFAVGDGIDAGLGLASPAIFFTFPSPSTRSFSASCPSRESRAESPGRSH
jgi:hypothetical protein